MNSNPVSITCEKLGADSVMCDGDQYTRVGTNVLDTKASLTRKDVEEIARKEIEEERKRERNIRNSPKDK